MKVKITFLGIISIIASCAHFPSSSFKEEVSKDRNIRFFTKEQDSLSYSNSIKFCERPGCSFSDINDYLNQPAVIDLSSRRRVDRCYAGRSCIRYDIYLETGPRLFLELRHVGYMKDSEEKALLNITNKYFIPYDRLEDWHKNEKKHEYDIGQNQEYILETDGYRKKTVFSFKPKKPYTKFSKYPNGPRAYLPYEKYAGMKYYFDKTKPFHRDVYSEDRKYRSVIFENGESYFTLTEIDGEKKFEKFVTLDEHNEIFNHPSYELLGDRLHPKGEEIVKNIQLSDRNQFGVVHELLLTDRFPPIRWVDFVGARKDLKKIGKVSDYDKAIYDLTKVNFSEQRKGSFKIEPVRNNRLGDPDYSSLFPFVVLRDGNPKMGHYVVHIGEHALHYNSVEISLNGETYNIKASNKWFHASVDSNGWPYVEEGFSFFGYLNHLNLAENLDNARVYYIGNQSQSAVGTNKNVLESSRSVISLYENILNAK